MNIKWLKNSFWFNKTFLHFESTGLKLGYGRDNLSFSFTEGNDNKLKLKSFGYDPKISKNTQFIH